MEGWVGWVGWVADWEKENEKDEEVEDEEEDERSDGFGKLRRATAIVLLSSNYFLVAKLHTCIRIWIDRYDR